MKKITLLFLFFTAIGFSQTKGISYQALILDPIEQQLPGFNNDKAPLANKNICLQFSIIDENTDDEYVETHTITTDVFGMVNLTIGLGTGTGGYATTFEDIVWSALPKNLKVAISMNESCTDFTEISNAPFTAVPFALFAVNTQNTPIVLNNEAEIDLLKALLKATQISAGINLDGSYTANSAANYINTTTSLKDADTSLDTQVKVNEVAIAGNLLDILTNTTAITTKVAITAIVDDLTTGGTTVPLSAEQGKELKNLIDTTVNITVEDNLATASATSALSAQQGVVLKGLVDTSITNIANKLDLAGGTMTGVIDMGTQNISNATSIAATTFSGDLNGTINTATTATTQTASNNSTKIATTAYADAASTDDQTAAEVNSTATGNIAATTVDSAIAELASEKLDLAGGTMTGVIDMGTQNISNATSIAATTFSGDLNGTINTATTATTQTASNNSTKIATTAYADAASTDDQTAAEVNSTATGNIAATTVDSAIAELASEKLDLAGGTMTGAIDMGTQNISNATSIAATTFSGDLNGSATTVITNANLTGEVTSVGNAATVPNATVIEKVLTGYTSGAGAVAATDNILQAIQKLDGNNATNANLTGPITSVGNTTSVTSQTGSGTKFVMDTSPTLVTPTIGVATATSITTSEIIDSGSGRINTAGGDVTINSMSGRFRISSATSVIITNSFVDANSILICTTASNSDHTRYIVEVSATAGSFTVTLNGSATVDINFLIIN